MLRPDAAKEAIRRPAREQGVLFKNRAAERLLRRLTTVRVQRPDVGVQVTQAPYVVPFQLQVVCRKLWTSLAEERGDAFESIEFDDVGSYDDVSEALRDYYAATVREVSRTRGVEEKAIRDWFEWQLITEQHFRSQTQTRPPVSRDQVGVLRDLHDAYLVCTTSRAGATWYELSHDNLIEPILASNEEIRSRAKDLPNDGRWRTPPPKADPTGPDIGVTPPLPGTGT